MTFKREPRRPSAVWVLVADRARARLFSGEWPDLEEFCESRAFAHPESTLRPRDIEADGPGRFREADGPTHAGDAETDFKHRTAIEFSRQIVDELERGKTENLFGRLVVIAPPLFLGVLRERLPDPIANRVIAEIGKDMTCADRREIQSHVREAISAMKSTS